MTFTELTLVTVEKDDSVIALSKKAKKNKIMRYVFDYNKLESILLIASIVVLIGGTSALYSHAMSVCLKQLTHRDHTCMLNEPQG